MWRGRGLQRSRRAQSARLPLHFAKWDDSGRTLPRAVAERGASHNRRRQRLPTVALIAGGEPRYSRFPVAEAEECHKVGYRIPVRGLEASSGSPPAARLKRKRGTPHQFDDDALHTPQGRRFRRTKSPSSPLLQRRAGWATLQVVKRRRGKQLVLRAVAGARSEPDVEAGRIGASVDGDHSISTKNGNEETVRFPEPPLPSHIAQAVAGPESAQLDEIPDAVRALLLLHNSTATRLM